MLAFAKIMRAASSPAVAISNVGLDPDNFLQQEISSRTGWLSPLPSWGSFLSLRASRCLDDAEVGLRAAPHLRLGSYGLLLAVLEVCF